MPARSIRTVRIDIPLVSVAAYLFVNPKRPDQDPWWDRLYCYLLEFSRPDMPWTYEPVQDVYWTRPSLSDADRASIVAFLRTAPRSAIEGHRTLDRAVDLPHEKHARVALVYFSSDAADGL